MWQLILAAASGQLQSDHVMMNATSARPWLLNSLGPGGVQLLATPKVVVRVASVPQTAGQPPTYDPMSFTSACKEVVLCNRHIYACETAPLECFLGGTAVTWHCPSGSSASCWTIQDGYADNTLPIGKDNTIVFQNQTATVYHLPGSVTAAEHLALAFGMLAIAIAVQHNAATYMLYTNWAVAITTVLISTATPARLGAYHHGAAVAAAAFTATQALLNRPLDGAVRSLALVAALSSVPVELLGLTPLMYAAFVISLCIAATAQTYSPFTFLCLVFWAGAGIDAAVAAAHLYRPKSTNEIVLSATITASAAAAGLLGQ